MQDMQGFNPGRDAFVISTRGVVWCAKLVQAVSIPDGTLLSFRQTQTLYNNGFPAPFQSRTGRFCHFDDELVKAYNNLAKSFNPERDAFVISTKELPYGKLTFGTFQSRTGRFCHFDIWGRKEYALAIIVSIPNGTLLSFRRVSPPSIKVSISRFNPERDAFVIST